MLTRHRIIVCLAAVLLLSAGYASRAGQKQSVSERALRVPVRLTAGASNQMMGVLSPDGRTLVFVSDRNATAEIFIQDPVDSGPRLLFESNADVAWPRMSPDGKWLAYISYKADAAGDLCLMDLVTKEHRCLTGLDSSEMQVLWMDAKRVAALIRPELHADYELRVFEPTGQGEGQLVIARNMLGPAIAPDGTWLVYVPVIRTAKQVGVSFSNRTAEGLALQRLGGTAEPVIFKPDLPGVTGFPTFAGNGRFLYFSQYLNDTNRDGVIDGNDNSILFRIRFDPGDANPVARAFPEQLTSAHWNCRYPSLAAGRLLATCSHAGSLDIYALPLDGAVPAAWKADRVRAELHAARNHWTKLLLLARLLTLEKKPVRRIAVLKQMVYLHVELGEHESAVYYCDQIGRLAGKRHAQAAGWARVMRALATHRREDIALSHGRLSDRYIQSENERARTLASGEGSLTKEVAVLARLVVSEIQDHIGRKQQATETFTGVDPAELTDPVILAVYACRAADIHELAGDRAALLSLYAGLAEHPALPVLDHMRYAERFIRELCRGVGFAERPALLTGWTQKTRPDSELGILLRVTALLAGLTPENQDEVRRGIFDIYKKHKDTDRRRAIVIETIKTAARLGNEYLQYQFATSWASLLKRADPERKYAERLYERIVIERAYTELNKNQIKGARGHFYATTLLTDSPEANIGFIEAWLREGRGDVVPTFEKRYAGEPDHPMWAFVQAYLTARTIAGVDDPEAFGLKLSGALGHLKKAAEAYPRSMEVHQLWGYLLHQRYIRTSDKHDAVSAHSHYLLALDLARTNERYQAALYQQVGLLQASLGNHRIALKHFVRRERLPQVRPAGELNFKLAMARSHFHIANHEQAVRLAEQALDMTRAHKRLAGYRPLVMDRLALYRRAAGAPSGALELYRRLVPMVDGGAPDDLGAPINRLKARLGVASAAIETRKYDLAVKQIAEIDAILESGDGLRPSVAGARRSTLDEHRFDKPDYEILVAGLLAQARRGQQDYPAAVAAMQRRYDAVLARFDRDDTDEDLLELARACYHLGEYTYRQKKPEPALIHFERGLAHSNAYNQRTGSTVNGVGLRLLQAYAELYLYGNMELRRYALDLKKQLEITYGFICEHPSPNWEADRFLFGIYLTMLELGGKPKTAEPRAVQGGT